MQGQLPLRLIIDKRHGRGSASADYIHLYHGNASLLIESLEVIQKTSAIILAALEHEQEPEFSDPS
jgi:hypothetical protein